MRKWRIAVLVCLLGLYPTTNLWAHHVSGGGAGDSALTGPVSKIGRPPSRMVSYVFTIDSLDEDRGFVIRNIFAGEYAIIPRFSVGLRIPLLSIRQSTRPPSGGISDIALILKGNLWKGKNDGNTLNLGLGTSFPTGDESQSLGEGEVQFSPYLNGTAVWGPVDFFTTIGGTLGTVADNHTSFIEWSAGLEAPIVNKGLPLHLFVSFDGILFFGSDVFQSGSSKGWIVGGLILYVQEKLPMTFAGKVSVLDTLSLLEGVVLDFDSTDLLSDVRFGFIFNTSYFF